MRANCIKSTELGRRQEQSNDLIKPEKLQRRLAYAFDRNGLVWNGYQLRDATGNVTLDISDQLASGRIDDRSFFRDKNGGFWLGTSFGLYQIRISQNYFQRLFYQPGNGKQPAVRGITAVGDTLYTNLENDVGLFASRRSGASARQLLAKQQSFRSLSGTVGGKLYLGEDYTPGRLRLPNHEKHHNAHTRPGSRMDHSSLFGQPPPVAGRWRPRPVAG